MHAHKQDTDTIAERASNHLPIYAHRQSPACNVTTYLWPFVCNITYRGNTRLYQTCVRQYRWSPPSRLMIGCQTTTEEAVKLFLG